MLFSILAQETQQNPLVAFLPLLLIGGVFYFLLIRPQQRRAKAQQALVRSAEVGDEIVTTAGIFGTIIGIDDEDVLTVEIAPGTRVRMVRGGIGRRITEDDIVDGEYDDDDDDADEGSANSPDDADEQGDQQGPFSQR